MSSRRLSSSSDESRSNNPSNSRSSKQNPGSRRQYASPQSSYRYQGQRISQRSQIKCRNVREGSRVTINSSANRHLSRRSSSHNFFKSFNASPRYSRYIPNDQGYDADVEDSLEYPQCHRRQNASPQRSHRHPEENPRFCQRTPSTTFSIADTDEWEVDPRTTGLMSLIIGLVSYILEDTNAAYERKTQEAGKADARNDDTDSTKKVLCSILPEAVNSMDSENIDGENCHSDCADAIESDDASPLNNSCSCCNDTGKYEREDSEKSCDCVVTMESDDIGSACVNESPSSPLNTSCSCCSDTDEHEDDEESCHSVYADTIESDDSHSLNTSCSCCNDTDEPESESSSDDSSIIDVDNHPDVKRPSNENEALQPVINLSGATIVQIHLDSSTVVSIPGANVKNTLNKSLIKCRNINKSRLKTSTSANKNFSRKSNCTN